MADNSYDIIIVGGGIAGLYAANRLQQAGYNLILFEKDKLGGQQTLASQGMIHGGQKYTMQGITAQAENISRMPDRWDDCFSGTGEINLSGVKVLSESQLMFPAGSFLSRFTVCAAARTVRGTTRRLHRRSFPETLGRGPVFEMHEKVIDVKSLIAALMQNLRGRVLQAEPKEILPTGQIAVDGKVLQAKMVIFTAGAGNEDAFRLLRITEKHTQRRPLRQVMVRYLPYAFYGHGITTQTKPRVTVTSHPAGNGTYIWYLGGNLAELGANMTEEETLKLAKKEMQEIFPAVDWEEKEWTSWQGDRAEAFDAAGELPPGPSLQQRGKVLIAWPTKLTFAPLLADQVMARLKENDISPSATTEPPVMPEPEIGLYPWETATWHRL